ncbi:MAG: hypothetical protein ACI3ZK_03910 [Candidatus Cryptobacteroides sp.]
MKRTFSIFAAVACAASLVFASCQPASNDEDENILKPGDGEENGGENGGNEDATSSLSGSEYVVLTLDEYSAAGLGKKIKANYGPDDVTRHLYVWEGTYIGGVCSGLNSYGEAAEWTSLVVTNVGWSGAGWFVGEEMPAFVANSSDLADWKFHIAYKGPVGSAHIIILTWNGSTYKFAIGSGQLEDNGVAYTAIAPVSGAFEANVWNEYEVSLADAGLDYTVAGKGDNLVSVLSGGVSGTTLDVDAIFFYKK